MLLAAFVGHATSYCFMGGDPGFHGGPKDKYVGDAYVKVSWWGLVKNK